MPLIRVLALDYHANYAYAPPAVESAVNTDEILSVVPTDARGTGPFVQITLRNGSSLTCRGTVEEILKKAESCQNPSI